MASSNLFTPFTFIVFFVSCLWSLCSNFCSAYCETPFVVWLERVHRTTAGIHNVIFTLLLGSSARNYDVTPSNSNNNKIFSTLNVGKRFLSVSLILGNDCKAMKIA